MKLAMNEVILGGSHYLSEWWRGVTFGYTKIVGDELRNLYCYMIYSNLH